MNIINHGTWSAYTPTTYPTGWPPGALFAKSDSTGEDWYQALGYNGGTPLLASGSIAVTAISINGQWITQAANADPTKVFPLAALLLEVQGYNGSNPQGDLGSGKVYDPNANTISAPTVNLTTYATAKQTKIAQGGFTVNANATGSPLNVSVSTQPAYANYLSSAVQLAQMMVAGTIPTANINWVQTSGTVALTPQQVITMGVAVASQVQATFTVLGQVIAAIIAGTITTTAEVDTPPSPIPAWPVNS